MTQRATFVAMSTEPLRHVKDHLSEYVERVDKHQERITITRNGRPAAVLVNVDDLASLEETVDVLGDPDVLADIAAGRAAAATGDVYTVDEVAEALRSRRRSA